MTESQIQNKRIKELEKNVEKYPSTQFLNSIQ